MEHIFPVRINGYFKASLLSICFWSTTLLHRNTHSILYAARSFDINLLWSFPARVSINPSVLWRTTIVSARFLKNLVVHLCSSIHWAHKAHFRNNCLHLAIFSKVFDAIWFHDMFWGLTWMLNMNVFEVQNPRVPLNRFEARLKGNDRT